MTCDYPLQWDPVSRTYFCRMCGFEQGEKMLDAHHRKPKRDPKEGTNEQVDH